MNSEFKPEQRFTRELWWVLEKIEYLRISCRSNEALRFNILVRPIPEPNAPSPDAQENSILKLEEKGAIQIFETDTRRSTYGLDYLFLIKVLQPKFRDVYNEYKKICFVEKTVTSKHDNSSQSMIQIPEDTEWSEIAIEFETFEKIRIDVKNKKCDEKSFQDIGWYSGSKNKKPDRKWDFLFRLATLEKERHTIPSVKKKIMADYQFNEKKKSKNLDNLIEKNKSDLSISLQRIFGISEDPFEAGETYKPKFKLTATRSAADDTGHTNQETPYKEYLPSRSRDQH